MPTLLIQPPGTTCLNCMSCRVALSPTRGRRLPGAKRSRAGPLLSGAGGRREAARLCPVPAFPRGRAVGVAGAGRQPPTHHSGTAAASPPPRAAPQPGAAAAVRNAPRRRRRGGRPLPSVSPSLTGGRPAAVPQAASPPLPAGETSSPSLSSPESESMLRVPAGRRDRGGGWPPLSGEAGASDQQRLLPPPLLLARALGRRQHMQPPRSVPLAAKGERRRAGSGEGRRQRGRGGEPGSAHSLLHKFGAARGSLDLTLWPRPRARCRLRDMEWGCPEASRRLWPPLVGSGRLQRQS